MPDLRKNEAAWNVKRNRWEIKVMRDGQRKSFYDGQSGKKGKIACERKADSWIEDGYVNLNIRFEQLWADYLEYIKPDKNRRSENGTGSGNYIKHESIGRNWLLPSLRVKKIDAISQFDWQQCINKAYKQGKSKKTLKNIRASITSIYEFALDKNLKPIQMRNLKIPEDAPVGKRTILNPSQIKTLFTKDSTVYRGHEHSCFYIHAFRFIFLTGIRRGEACGIDLVDIDNNVLHINKSYNQSCELTPGKTKNAKRSMVLSNSALKEIAAQKNMLKRMGIISPFLFPDEFGNRSDPKHVYNVWENFRKHHDISCSIHELRHSMISIAKADVPEQILKQIVGHSTSMDTFGVYGHEFDGEKERAADILEKIYNQYI